MTPTFDAIIAEAMRYPEFLAQFDRLGSETSALKFLFSVHERKVYLATQDERDFRARQEYLAAIGRIAKSYAGRPAALLSDGAYTDAVDAFVEREYGVLNTRYQREAYHLPLCHPVILASFSSHIVEQTRDETGVIPFPVVKELPNFVDLQELLCLRDFYQEVALLHGEFIASEPWMPVTCSTLPHRIDLNAFWDAVPRLFTQMVADSPIQTPYRFQKGKLHLAERKSYFEPEHR